MNRCFCFPPQVCRLLADLSPFLQENKSRGLHLKCPQVYDKDQHEFLLHLLSQLPLHHLPSLSLRSVIVTGWRTSTISPMHACDITDRDPASLHTVTALRIEKSSVPDHALDYLEYLTELTISASRWTNLAFHKLTRLRKVEISNTKFGCSFHKWASLQCLNALSLRDVSFVHPGAASGISIISHLSNLTGLTFLTTANGENVESNVDAALAAVPGLPCLRHLIFSCSTQQQIVKAAAAAASLSWLHLVLSMPNTEQQAIAVPDEGKRTAVLENLTVESTGDQQVLHPPAMQTIVTCLKQVASLVLQDCI